jgi:hypothetical protein
MPRKMTTAAVHASLVSLPLRRLLFWTRRRRHEMSNQADHHDPLTAPDALEIERIGSVERDLDS